MERTILREVTRSSMTARINSRKVKPMFYPNFFGVKRKTTLTWETLQGEKGVPVMADVVSFDSSAPQKTREVISKMSGDIPKTAVKRGMNESDWNEYNRLRAENTDAGTKELVDLAFKDQDFVFNSVRARYEWWCMQLLSKGHFILSRENNNGIVTETPVSCGMPVANQKVAKVDWANLNTADGLQDIEDVLVAASNAGVTINYIVMRKNDFSNLKKQKATTDKIKAWINQTAKITITKKVINDYLAEQEYSAKIVLVDPRVRYEDSSHKRVTINPWENHHITFLETLNVGDIQHGPIAAENSEVYKKKAVAIKKDFIFISKWSELEPFKEWTKAEANAIPVLNDPDAIFILKADAKTWGDVNTDYTDISGEDIRVAEETEE